MLKISINKNYVFKILLKKNEKFNLMNYIYLKLKAYKLTLKYIYFNINFYNIINDKVIIYIFPR